MNMLYVMIIIVIILAGTIIVNEFGNEGRIMHSYRRL
jgi:hypothetical protein